MHACIHSFILFSLGLEFLFLDKHILPPTLFWISAQVLPLSDAFTVATLSWPLLALGL